MSEPIFIAVGGSGQHVLLSYLRLARLGNFQPARMIVVDADNRTGEGGAQTTADLIAQQASVGFREEVKQVFIQPLPKLERSQDETFRSMVDPTERLEIELFKALFNQRQRDVKVLTGFHGHPSVAASTFRMFLEEEENELKTVLDDWLAGQGVQKVVLAGSTFGGTGSGVMPVLADYLRKLASERGLTLQLGGVIQVRWFNLNVPTEIEGGRDQYLDVANNDLDNNSSCLVEYYRRKVETMFHRGYLVGHHPHALRQSAGTQNQPEHPHAVNLLCGHVAYRLLHQKFQSDAKGLLAVYTPDGALENHLELPFPADVKAKGSKARPLSEHIKATGAELAIGQALLNVLSSGNPGPDVVDPYPPFVTELVERSDGSFGRPRRGSGDVIQPYSSWSRLLRMQAEALSWLTSVRNYSKSVEACQFPEWLVPSPRDVGRIEEHEQQLRDPLPRAFQDVLGKMSSSAFSAEESSDEKGLVRSAFYSVRDEIERQQDKRG